MVLGKLHFQMKAQHLEALTTHTTAIYVLQSLVLLMTKYGAFLKFSSEVMWKQRKDVILFSKTVILLINVFMWNCRFFFHYITG